MSDGLGAATRHCLDLFAGLGGFSAAFEDSDEWEVTTVDVEPEFEPDIERDVMDLEPGDLPGGYIVLASPPCTYFSTAGNHDKWTSDKRPLDEARRHVTLVYHTLGLIHALSPEYWFLENPRGRLRWFLGEPTGTVTYCQYGRDYQKPTDLWGRHPPGMSYRSCPKGADCHVRNTEDDGTAAIASMPSDVAERRKVPRELSAAILRACEGRHEQSTLPGVAP